jgi:hypothetical protein
MPFTRVPRVNSVSLRRLASSREPSGLNGVGVML